MKRLQAENLENRLALSADPLVGVAEAAEIAPAEFVETPEYLSHASGLLDNSVEQALDRVNSQNLEVLEGDFDNSGDYNVADIDMLCAAMGKGFSTTDSTFDLTGDDVVDMADMERLVVELMETSFGDANLDGTVDEGDFKMMRSNFFQEASSWAQGDFNCDGITDGQDFLVWNANKFRTPRVIANPGPAATMSHPEPLSSVATSETPAVGHVEGRLAVNKYQATSLDGDSTSDLRAAETVEPTQDAIVL